MQYSSLLNGNPPIRSKETKSFFSVMDNNGIGTLPSANRKYNANPAH